MGHAQQPVYGFTIERSSQFSLTTALCITTLRTVCSIGVLKVAIQTILKLLYRFTHQARGMQGPAAPAVPAGLPAPSQQPWIPSHGPLATPPTRLIPAQQFPPVPHAYVPHASAHLSLPREAQHFGAQSLASMHATSACTMSFPAFAATPRHSTTASALSHSTFNQVEAATGAAPLQRFVTVTGAVGQAAAVPDAAAFAAVATRDSVTNYATQAVAHVAPAPGAPLQVSASSALRLLCKSRVS
jgi:hypothetical protein